MIYQFGGISFQAIEVDGSIVLSDLTGGGNPADLLAAMKAVSEIAEKVPVYLAVDYDNPRKEALMRVYERFMGAKETAMLMKVGDR
jgi:hypothetical protein